MADVELTVSLQVNLMQWTILKDHAKIILAAPDVLIIPGAQKYTIALMNQVQLRY